MISATSGDSNTNNYVDKIDDKNNGDIIAKESRKNQGHHNSVTLVLIDTEGFDCNIVNGISFSSPFLPEYLIFETAHCKEESLQMAWDRLEEMGYTLRKT